MRELFAERISRLGYESRRFSSGQSGQETKSETVALNTPINAQQLLDPFLPQNVLRTSDRSVQSESLKFRQGTL
jgi:hypothetical protein